MMRSRLLRSSFSLTRSTGAGGRPFLSSMASQNPPEKPPAAAAAGSILNDEAVSSSSSAAADTASASGSKKSWSFLKFGILSAITGAVGVTGYATYAYTSDELEQKAANLKSSVKHTVPDNASGLEKFQSLVYSTGMKVPIKATEIYLDIRRSIEEQVKGFTEPSSDKLLPDLHPQEQHVFTLVLDVNETLVYSDWTRERGWRTFKRPGVEAFLEHLSQFYEIVVYSDQLNMYLDPVMERLDQKGYVRYRLSRPATKYVKGKHYRDLSKLNRDPSHVLYLSGHALESCLQKENCVPVKPWKLEADDTALLDLIPFLEYVARHRPADIRTVLASYEGRDMASEFIERSKEYQRKMQEQKRQGRGWWR